MNHRMAMLTYRAGGLQELIAEVLPENMHVKSLHELRLPMSRLTSTRSLQIALQLK
jgi:hypothetical protein